MNFELFMHWIFPSGQLECSPPENFNSIPLQWKFCLQTKVLIVRAMCWIFVVNRNHTPTMIIFDFLLITSLIFQKWALLVWVLSYSCIRCHRSCTSMNIMLSMIKYWWWTYKFAFYIVTNWLTLAYNFGLKSWICFQQVQ